LLVHAGERQRRDAVAAWTRRGLDVGAKILYLESADEIAERSFLTLMQERGIEVSGALDDGQLQVVRADEATLSPRWQVGVVEKALVEGYDTVRWSSEARTVWSVLSASGQEVLEWVTDELCGLRPLSVLCQYPSDLPEITLQTVCSMHTHGVRGAGLGVVPTPTGIALTGEIDAANEKVLRGFLRSATASKGRSRDPFVVDMSGLTFLDASGARALLAGTKASRITGGSVCLRSPQPRVARVLRILGMQRVEGILIE
jgi:anti-anti-sigma factor